MNVLSNFLHAILCLECPIPLQTIIDRSWINIVTSSQLICDVMRTRHIGIVTSYSSFVLARANWDKGDLH